MKKIWIKTLTLGVALALSVPVLAETGVTDTRIVIGCTQSLTGPVSHPGSMQVAGTQAYLEAVNAQGGVNGRKFEFKVFDDGYRPQDAVANVKRLIEQDGAFLILNTMGTAPSKAILPFLEENKTPLLFPFQGDPEMSKKKYLFTSYPFHDIQTRIITRWLLEKKGMKRIALIYQDDAYGQPFLDTLKEELKARGLEPAALESIKRGSSDATVQVAKMAEIKPEACILALTPGQGAQVLKEAAKLGWTSSMLVASGPLADETFLTLAGGDSEGIYGFSSWPDPSSSQLPEMKKYREALASYQPKQAPSRHNLYGYFYAKTMAEGIKRAGKDLTRESFIGAMESMKDWDSGIIPPISYSTTDHHTQYDGFIVQAKGGRFLPVSGWLSVKTGNLTETPMK